MIAEYLLDKIEDKAEVCKLTVQLIQKEEARQ